MSHAATPATRTATVPARATHQDRSPTAIQAEMESTRNRLAGTIDQIVYRSHPKTIATRKLDEVKARFIDEQGQPRTEEIANAAGAVMGFLTLMVSIRKVVNGG